MAITLAAVSALAFGAGGARAEVAAKLDRNVAAAPRYAVRIRRDHFGVPHVLGRTDADAAYGLGFAQCEDDFVTVQDSLMTSRGRQAMSKGAEGVPSDTLFALMDVNGTLDAGYEKDL